MKKPCPPAIDLCQIGLGKKPNFNGLSTQQPPDPNPAEPSSKGPRGTRRSIPAAERVTIEQIVQSPSPSIVGLVGHTRGWRQAVFAHHATQPRTRDAEDLAGLTAMPGSGVQHPLDMLSLHLGQAGQAVDRGGEAFAGGPAGALEALLVLELGPVVGVGDDAATIAVGLDLPPPPMPDRRPPSPAISTPCATRSSASA